MPKAIDNKTQFFYTNAISLPQLMQVLALSPEFGLILNIMWWLMLLNERILAKRGVSFWIWSQEESLTLCYNNVTDSVSLKIAWLDIACRRN